MNNDNQMLKNVIDLIDNMKAKKPLVECLTNRVTINDCANMVLAMGASPIMAEIECEMEEIMSISDALVINLGLLDEQYLSAMRTAANRANELGKPIVLDPVGAGASKLRDRVCREMIAETHPTIIRGNLSEIKSLSGVSIQSKGVDASADDEVNDNNRAELGEVVRKLAIDTDSIVCATGKVDIVSDGNRIYYIENGHEMLCDVTGTGCMCTAMTGATAAAGDPLTAVIASIMMMGIAGEYAHEYVVDSEQGIGTFRVKLFDYVYNMQSEDYIKRGELYCE